MSQLKTHTVKKDLQTEAGKTVKIRTLPRPTEDFQPPPKNPETSTAVFRLVIAGICLAAMVGVFALPFQKTEVTSGKTIPLSHDPHDQVVDRYLHEAKIRKQLIEQELKLRKEAQQDTGSQIEMPVAEVNSDSYGVQLDQEDTMERVYQDLNEHQSENQEALLQDKINARLANRKWVNEYERAQRIEFVRSFLKSAYDKGYEIQLDENLVVVKVRKLDKKVQKVDINHVVDKLAREVY